MLEKISHQSWALKRLLTFIYDATAIFLSFYLAYAIQLSQWQFEIQPEEFSAIAATTLLSSLCFIKLGLYRAIMRYITLIALTAILIGGLLSSLFLEASLLLFSAPTPKTLPIIYCALILTFIGTPRVLIRILFYHEVRRKKPAVIIYGAGKSGVELASALLQGRDFHPVAFIDDDTKKYRHVIFGITIHSAAEIQMLINRYHPVKILIAINSISHAEKYQLLQRVREFPIEIQSIPSMEELASGRARLSEIRDIDIADLLGRESVPPVESLMVKNITNQVVMVTGAGGSIGSELCREILLRKPASLVMFESNEFNLYQIDREINDTATRLGIESKIIATLGSVQRLDRLEAVIKAFKVDTLYHAAAYKHVPIVESNIIEGIRNNVLGTFNVAQCAKNHRIKQVVLISTDKAVRPTNIMGASKRLAELVILGFAEQSLTTRFITVRFGNVLGSSGSVVPLFREQIKRGGPVTVTHRDVTRFFMTITEAAQLVIQAGSLGQNGRIYLLDMGTSVLINDLAKAMIELMGFRVQDASQPDGDIKIEYQGLRPGEKLKEELVIEGTVTGTNHPKILTVEEPKLKYEEMIKLISELQSYCDTLDIDHIYQILNSEITQLNNHPEIHDLLWITQHKEQLAHS